MGKLIYNISLLLLVFAAAAGVMACSSGESKNLVGTVTESQVNPRFDMSHVAHRQLFDTNDDHIVDMWKIFEMRKASDEDVGKLVLVRKELDANFDGHPDTIMYYNIKEELVREEQDVTFDGLVDLVRHYDKGEISKIEYFSEENTRYGIDAEGSVPGIPNSTKYYRKGRLTREEFDDNLDGQMERVIIYNAEGKIAQQGSDINGDGIIDDWTRY